MDLYKLRKKVKAARGGSVELDKNFAMTFKHVPANITISIDAAALLIGAELPGWWWWCGSEQSGTVASVELGNWRCATAAPDTSNAHLRKHAKLGWLFDAGFHGDSVCSTVPLAMLNVFLQGKIALERAKTPSATVPPSHHVKETSCSSAAATKSDALSAAAVSPATLARMEAEGWLSPHIFDRIKKAGLCEDEIKILLDGVE